MSPERFIDLVRTEQESLRRFLLALCAGDSFEADDIAQDALVRAYVASGSFLGLSKFSTWLFRIAYNCYIDHKRRHDRKTTDLDSPEVLQIAAIDETDAAFKYQQLYNALDKIPDKERAAIILHYFEELSIKEIASILQIPAGTVKYHLSNGRNHLKSILK